MGNNPSYFSSFFKLHDEYPVENISWEEVQQFIDKLNGKSGRKRRLPTEAEWEHSCRAGTSSPFNTGECLYSDQANYNGNYPLSDCDKCQYRKKTLPIGSFPPNQWGLYDMHGNVWEWCQDWYGDYPQVSVTDPEGPRTGSYRVIRGGGWNSSADRCRSADRDWSRPSMRNSQLGFRLVLSLGQQ